MPDPDRIIRLNTVLDRTGLSRSTLCRKIAEGTFPAQLKISIHGAGCRDSEINDWVKDPIGWRADAWRTQSAPKRQVRSPIGAVWTPATPQLYFCRPAEVSIRLLAV